jgi:hypothetical protein
MANTIKRNLIVTAAVGAISLCVHSTASAQYRIDTGRSNDANNRIGGSGLNGGDDSRVGRGNFAGLTGNDIVTGNVTGGKAFRGSVPYGDPTAFRDNLTAHPSDALVRDSAGTPYAGASANNASVVQPFYGDARQAPPPPGYVRTGIGTPGYVPSNMPDYRIGSDLRLGDIGQQPAAINQLGMTVLPGPVDTSTNDNTLLTMSALYGVRQWNAGNYNDQQFLQQYANPFNQQNLNNQAPLSDLAVNAMRREVQQAAGNQSLQVNPSDVLSGQNNQLNQQAQPNGAAPAPNGNLAQPLAPMMEAPNNQALPNAPLQGNLQSGPISGSLDTGEGLQARMMVPAAQQTTANAQLQARLDEINGTKKPQNDVEASQEFNKQLAAAKAAQEKQGTQPGQNQQTNTTNQPTDQNAAPTQTGANKNTPPPQIHSFAEGVKAKGLGDILKKGEDLMKQGKWFSAIEQYDQAEQVVPNNMLVAIGRANAELGGSYYGRAEADIRRAFTQDPATLEGQYDLRTMIGDDRLQFLVGDLKDIANKNPTQPRAPFLLAYIAYNTGNDRMAAGYLDLAEKRAGAGDTFYTLVRKHWTLPDKGDTQAPDLNK